MLHLDYLFSGSPLGGRQVFTLAGRLVVSSFLVVNYFLVVLFYRLGNIPIPLAGFSGGLGGLFLAGYVGFNIINRYGGRFWFGRLYPFGAVPE